MPPLTATALPFVAPAAPRSRTTPSNTSLELTGAVSSYGRDQEIFGQGEPARHVYKVLTGAVRCFKLLSDGRRQIADFYLPGDVFGVEAGGEYRVTAESLTETAVVVARCTSLTDGDEIAHAQALWRLAIGELQRSQEHALTLGRRSATERVASFLVDVAERLGADDAFVLPMTRQDMADYLGLTIETVSRTLSQLQATGLIKTGACRRIQIVDRAALEDLCE